MGSTRTARTPPESCDTTESVVPVRLCLSSTTPLTPREIAKVVVSPGWM